MAELDRGRGADATIDTSADATGAPVVRVSGDIDITNAAALEAAAASAAARRPERLIFDLSGLRFIDSAGIAVLLEAAEKVDAVQLRNPSAAVRRVVELTGLTDVLPIEP